MHDPRLAAHTWREEPLCVVAGVHSPLARSRRLTAATLSSEIWLLREPGSGTRRQFDRSLAPALGRFTVRLELEHTEAIKRAVESGLGIGCLSRLALREAFRRGSLFEVATPDFDLRRRFHIVRHARRHESSAVQAFRQMCDAVCGAAERTSELALPFIP